LRILQISGQEAYLHLHADIMQSVKWMFPSLLENYRVLLYQGQFDLQDGVLMNEAWISTIPWDNIEQYFPTQFFFSFFLFFPLFLFSDWLCAQVLES
jgi:hypothetical protein